jgi:uncharacterized protein
MLTETIQKDIAVALKAGDSVRAGALRFLLSAVRNSGIAKYGRDADTKLTDADVLDVVKKQVKSHRESIIAFEAAGRDDLAGKERRELEILESFLPPDMPDAEIASIVDSVISQSQDRSFGPLMGRIMARVSGRAGGDRVSAILKSKLS